MAEYAFNNKLVSKPAFAWWAPHTLKKRNAIIFKVKTRYWKRTHKYGVGIPNSVQEALRIDKETGTTFWQDAIRKEMTNVMVAFQILDNDEPVPIGYQKIDCHIVFDVKLEGLVCKAQLVAGGHQTDIPPELVFSSVVSCDRVRIMFLTAALNDLNILLADVQNAYLNAPTKERVYTIAGLEFGSKNVGKRVLIVRALYGLRSFRAQWRDHMASTL